MGGSVAFAIKRNGRVATREFSKHAATHLSRGDFFEGKGDVWQQWKKFTAQPFAPIDYGLVVVDFDAKWAAGIQSYTSLHENYVNTVDAEDVADLETLWRQGRIEWAQDTSKKNIVAVPLEGQEFKDWLAPLLPKKREKWHHSITVKVAPPAGWSVDSFEGDQAGWIGFVSALRARGFKFTEKNISVWGEFLHDKDLPDNIMGEVIASNTAKLIEANTASVSSMRPRRRI